MSNITEHENEVERAKRLRETIERLKSGRLIKRPAPAKSLREQIAERANRLRPPRRPRNDAPAALTPAKSRSYN